MEGSSRMWWWGAAAVGIVLAGIGYWFWLPKSPLEITPPPAAFPSPAPAPSSRPLAPSPAPTASPTAAAARSDGNQYRDAAFGYSLWYPKTWRTESCGNGCQSFGPQVQPEETGVEVTVVAAPLDAAKTHLPIFTNPYNRQKSEEPVSIGGTVWTKLLIEQQTSGLVFTKHLIERNGRTFVFSLGGESPTTTAIYLQMLESFGFTTK